MYLSLPYFCRKKMADINTHRDCEICEEDHNGCAINPLGAPEFLCNKCALENGFKKCSAPDCEFWKKLDQFHLCNKSKTGRASRCKACQTEYYKSRKEPNLILKTKKFLHEFYLGNLNAKSVKKAEKLVGCSREQYVGNLTWQWQNSMSLANYSDEASAKDGTWQIVYHTPFEAFEGEVKANLRIICLYSNVAPVWYEHRSQFKHEDREVCETTYERTTWTNP